MHIIQCALYNVKCTMLVAEHKNGEWIEAPGVPSLVIVQFALQCSVQCVVCSVDSIVSSV